VQIGIVMPPPDDFAAEQPDMVAVPGQCLVGQPLAQQINQKGFDEFDDVLSDEDIAIPAPPRARPISAKSGQSRSRAAVSAGIMEGLFILLRVPFMLLPRFLNACHCIPGFVYAGVRLNEAAKTIEVKFRLRRGSKPVCSGCGKPACGYDTLPARRFEFIPVWGFAVLLLYPMRRAVRACCGWAVSGRRPASRSSSP